MIPPTDEPSPKTAKGPAAPPPRRCGESAELSCHESADGTTGSIGFGSRFGLREDADHGLRSGRAHQNPAFPLEFRIQPLDPTHDALGKLADGDPHVRLGLWKTLHLGGRLLERPAFERTAKQEPRP